MSGRETGGVNLGGAMKRITFAVCLALVLLALSGCGDAATAGHPPSPSPSPPPSPPPTWHEVAWMSGPAMVGMTFSKPFRISSPEQRVEWSVTDSDLYRGNGVDVYIGPAARTNDLDDGSVRIVHAKHNHPGHHLLSLKPGRYVLSFDAYFGLDVKVRLSERKKDRAPRGGRERAGRVREGPGSISWPR